MSEGKPRLYMKEYKVDPDANDYGFDDDTWNFEKFKEKFRIHVVRLGLPLFLFPERRILIENSPFVLQLQEYGHGI